VTTKRGVLVAVKVVVVDAVIVAVAVSVAVKVPVAVAVSVGVCVGVEVGGSAVGLTEAASAPTARSTPQTSGRERVAEYTHVGFSSTPLICIVAPQARVSLKVRLQVGLTGASGPYN
jgi:hypothetical protein